MRSKLAVHVIPSHFADEYAANPNGNEAAEPEAEAEPEAVAEPEAPPPPLLVEAEEPPPATVVSEEGRHAWKRSMPVHAAVKVETDGLTPYTYE
jgi:hypothetical protein|eukprot:COSAG01_NODE_141_length_24253_cov_36.101130_12_plen_94_part_00